MLIQVHDTMSRSVKALGASDGRRFRVYCCGPTVYAPAHIGNFRTFVLNDVLRRTALMAGLPVFFVRNLTDVDDKTIAAARTSGQSLIDLTNHWIDVFHEDEKALNLLPADAEPRATDHLPEQIALIEQLLAKDLAYVASDGSVYYRVAAFPAYGRLSGFDPEELRSQQENSAGATNQADEYDRETVADFALWKAWKAEDGDVAWDSPWGRGRPGWHLECSAMSRKLLGDGFDLHTGGVDLCFPHHENEIAQSEGAFGTTFCHHWWHASHLLVDGKKMSKSLGNFHTVRDLLAAGQPPLAIRYALTFAHYRQQLNFTLKSVEEATMDLGRVRLAAEHAVMGLSLAHTQHLPEGLRQLAGPDLAAKLKGEFAALRERPEAGPAQHVPGTLRLLWDAVPGSGVFTPAIDFLTNDLNTPGARGVINSSIRAFRSKTAPGDWQEPWVEHVAGLTRVLFCLGLEAFIWDFREAPAAPAAPEVPGAIRALADQRWAARAAKDWAASDRLRAELAALGWTVRDRKDGYDLEPTPGAP